MAQEARLFTQRKGGSLQCDSRMEFHVFKRTLYNFTCDLGWCYQKLVSIRLTEQSERPEKASFLKQSVLPKTALVWGNPWLMIKESFQLKMDPLFASKLPRTEFDGPK